MARIRTIKPEFFRHRRLFTAEVETGLPLRVAFAGLWTVADREGRFKWEPDEIKLDCLPYDNVDFSRVLDALVTRGFLVKYEFDGREYGWIPGFADHQVINNREAKSSLPPAPKNAAKTMLNLTRQPREQDASFTRYELAQGEGKGREEERNPPKAPQGAPLVAEPKKPMPSESDRIDAVRKIVWRLAGLSEDQIGTKLVSTSQEGVSQSRAWLQDLKLDVEAIRDAASQAFETSSEPVRRPWVYLDTVMRRVAEDRDKPELTERDHEDPQRATWRVKIQRFQQLGKWFGHFGPKPGEPGCACPPDILAEFGYGLPMSGSRTKPEVVQ